MSCIPQQPQSCQFGLQPLGKVVRVAVKNYPQFYNVEGGHMSISVFNIKSKNCATCNYWQHQGRTFDFAGKTPVRVKCEAKEAQCSASSNKKTKGVDNCTRWTKWLMIP